MVVIIDEKLPQALKPPAVAGTKTLSPFLMATSPILPSPSRQVKQRKDFSSRTNSFSPSMLTNVAVKNLLIPFKTPSGVEIFNSLGENFVVQKRIIPHPDFSVFNSSSINTIRIMTYIANGEMHHVPIAFRIGRKGKNVDNIHSGGLVVGVRDDGTLLPNAYELGYGDKTTKYSQHPDSKVTFDGYKLPYIPEIINSAYAIHKRLVNIGIVSWDFTVDCENNPVLIEANIRGQSIWFPQIVHGKGAFGEYTKDIIKMIK